MELELEAILGHKSAHSLATGPVTADPETNKMNNFEQVKTLKIVNIQI